MTCRLQSLAAFVIVFSVICKKPTIITCPALEGAELTKMETSCPTTSYDATKRTQFGNAGVAVFGWPSSGGVLVKGPADLVDLQFLGVERLRASKRSKNPSEEDAFCENMRKIGAKWWESEEEYFSVLLGERERTKMEERELVMGWPSSGGIWVLRYERQRDIPKDFGRLHMAMNMDERSEVIQEYGGRFCGDPERYEEFCKE